jgi:hypothetical protein
MNVGNKIIVALLFFVICKKTCGQQNLFNVPSLEITKEKKHFVQYQANFTDQFQSNLTYDYGLGKGCEIGLNVLALNADPGLNSKTFIFNDSFRASSPLCPLVMLNAQKEFKWNKLFKVSSGFQFGTNVSQHFVSGNRPAIFFYINSKLSLVEDKLQCVNGIYYGNKAYLGSGAQINMMNGVEYSVFKRVHLMGDVFWGNNYISECVIGMVYYVTAHFTVSAGYQMPTVYSKSSKGYVFELTLF